MIQERIALSEIDIETSRALIWKCAWALDQGQRATRESSIAKAHVAEAVGRVVDRAVQICGSLGVSGDLPLARMAAEVGPCATASAPSRPGSGSCAADPASSESMATEYELIEAGGREVRISSPGKLIFAAAQITKRDLIDYYLRVAEPTLRQLRDRPTVL